MGRSEMNPTNFKKISVFSVAIFLFLTLIGDCSSVFASAKIATVQKVSGTAMVFRQGQTLTATVGLEILENDSLRTGPNGSMGVVFIDDTLLSLGPGSVLVIEKFLFAPRQGKFSFVLRMIKGTAAYLSGLISRLAPEAAYFETPTASIGIRGTKFVVKIEGEPKR
jgi:hypothetical protein